MASTTLYSQEGKYKITVRPPSDITDSELDWNYAPFKTFFEILLSDTDSRRVFFQTVNINSPPILFSDPNDLFGENISFPDSGFFRSETIVLFKKNDEPEKIFLRQVVLNLLNKNLIKKDRYSIVYCKDCNEFSIGNGDTSKSRSFHCVRCSKHTRDKKTQNGRVTNVFTFKPEIRDLIFGHPQGKLLEGMVYIEFASSNAILERFDIVQNAQLVLLHYDSEGREIETCGEKDLFLLDKQKILPPIAILSSTSSTSSSEKRQVKDCTDIEIPTIFVCGKAISEKGTIHEKSKKVFDNVLSDPDFPKKLVQYVLDDLVPELTTLSQTTSNESTNV